MNGGSNLHLNYWAGSPLTKREKYILRVMDVQTITLGDA